MTSTTNIDLALHDPSTVGISPGGDGGERPQQRSSASGSVTDATTAES
ncbi:MAG: hypothetical protein ACE37B_16380 [Ilumatobacter sp.]|jgi:hypothetical protein